MTTTTEGSTDVLNILQQISLGTFTLERILELVLLLAGCLVGMKLILFFLDKGITRLKVERSLHTFIKSVVRILLWFVVILIMADAIGIPITSLVALFSVIGLAISLAIQGTLSNLAGGIMILVSKPFKVGDYIEAGGMGGTVADIGLVYTRMTTIDNKMVYLPNKEISGSKITNYNAQEERRVDVTFNVSYDAPVETVKDILLKVVHDHSKTLFTPEPLARVYAYKDSSVEYIVRVWCATDDYWTVYFDLMEQVKAAFDKAGIELTYNHLNVHILNEKQGGN